MSENTNTTTPEEQVKAAVAIDAGIRENVTSMAVSVDRLADLIDQAKNTPDFLALIVTDGKPWKDWTAYVQDVLKSVDVMHHSIREPFVALLTTEGMSVREQGRTLKVSKSAIAKTQAKLARQAAKDAKQATPGAPENQAQDSHRTRAGERLYKQLSVVVPTEDKAPLTDAKQYTDADLKKLVAQLKQVVGLVESQQAFRAKEARNQAVVSMVSAHPERFADIIAAADAAALEQSMANHPANGRRQGNQSRTGRIVA